MENNINYKKEKEKEIEEQLEERASTNRRIKNKINSFLNKNFQYFSFLLLFLVFLFSFKFILLPKYEKAVITSNEVLEAKNRIFEKEYRELVSYRKNIEVFESIDKGEIDKIGKMIPRNTSREDVFMEFAYFLMKNNFNIKSLNVSDPLETSTPERISRRAMALAPDSNSELDSKISQRIYSLPNNISSWLVKAEVSAVNYIDLKYLLDIIENNLKITDIINLDFDPTSKTVSFDALVYYFKN